MRGASVVKLNTSAMKTLEHTHRSMCPHTKKGVKQANLVDADKEPIFHTSKTGLRTLFCVPQAVYGPLHCATHGMMAAALSQKKPDAEHTRG